MVQREYQTPNGSTFSVTFPDESFVKHAWRWDQMHNPTPLTPLSAYLSTPKGQGMGGGMRLMGGPPGGAQIIRANGYVFRHVTPPTPEDIALHAPLMARDRAERVDRLVELFEGEYRPEVEALTRSIREWARPDDALPDLVGKFDQVVAAIRRLGQLHAITLGLTGAAIEGLQELCQQHFPERAGAMVGELTSGVPNRSLDSADGLWQLSRAALARPAVAALLRDSPPSEVRAHLGDIDGGPEFIALLDTYLEEFGHRNESFTELIAPTWREDPHFALFTVASYLDLPVEQSPGAMHERSARRRETVLAEALQALPDEATRDAFRAAQRRAAQRSILIEDHNFYIDQRGHVAVREACQAIGRRLVEQGAIDAVDDVFFLEWSEIEGAAADRGRRCQPTVEERRSERNRWLRVLPPAFVGDGEPEEFMTDFFGPDEFEPADPGSIRGVPASGGVVRGTARLILGLDEVDRFETGDILVTYATAPPWTPLFALAAAVVTDVGGVLSHCAVVAREYGIPAVTGTKLATAQIVDGSTITVDGDAGVVRLED